jgi:hypothetical protein
LVVSIQPRFLLEYTGGKWHAQVPNLAFVGLPHSVVPFPLMELQAEAVWTQWQNCTLLPDAKERLRDAIDNANSSGTVELGIRRRVVDTHYLGDAQWDYCREMVQLAGLDHNTTTTCVEPAAEVSTEAYIRMNKALYDYVGRYRKSLLPGGPDLYRSLIFTRYPTQDKFEVMMMDPSSVDECNVDEKSSNSDAALDTGSQHQSVNKIIITV